MDTRETQVIANIVTESARTLAKRERRDNRWTAVRRFLRIQAPSTGTHAR